MKIFTDSFIISLVVRFWDCVCELYSGSFLCHTVSRLTALWKRGFLYSLLNWESRLEPVWQSSFFYRTADALVNLVPNLLSKVYGKSKHIIDSSCFCTLLNKLGRNTHAFLALMLLVLLIVPQGMWNNLYSLIMAVGCLALFWFSGIFDATRRIKLSVIGPWPVLFALISCLSFVWSQDISLSFRYLLFHITCIILVLTVVSAINTEKQLFGIVYALAAGLIVCCSYAVLQRISGIAPSSSFTDLNVNSNMPGRVFSFFENPNAFANILVFFTPLMTAMIFFSDKWWQRAGFTAAAGLCCLALIMTYSRGGWLSLAFSIFVLMLLLCPRWVPLVVILGCMAVPFLPENILSRILSIFSSDSSISSRSYIYSAVVRLLEQNWFYGVGLGTTTLKRGIYYYGVFTSKVFPFVHAHNILLEIWGESGVFAAIAFVMTMFFAFRKGTAIKKLPVSPIRGIFAGAISGLAGSMVFGLTDYAWSYPRVMVLFWFLFAIIYTSAKISRKKEGSQNE